MAANRDAFTEFRVEYEVTSGDVATEEDALKGKFTNGEQATAVWTRRDGDETYRVVFRTLDPAAPVEEIPVRPARNGVGDIVIPRGSSAKDNCYVARGDYFASHTPSSKACMINRSRMRRGIWASLNTTHLGLISVRRKHFGPYAFLKASVVGKTTAEVESITNDGQSELVTIFIHGKDTKESRFRLLASSEWGYLPREYSYRTSPTAERLP